MIYVKKKLIESTPRSNLSGFGPFAPEQDYSKKYDTALVAQDKIQDMGNQPNDLAAYMEKICSYLKELFDKYMPLIQQARDMIEDEDDSYVQLYMIYLKSAYNHIIEMSKKLVKYRNQRKDMHITSMALALSTKIRQMQTIAKNLIISINRSLPTGHPQLDKLLIRLVKLPIDIYNFCKHTNLADFLDNPLFQS